MRPRKFRVVTSKNWLAEQFAPMGAARDYGWDINPATALDTVWWAPGAWVASAANSGIHLPLTSCGPDWLVNLPKRHRGRKVQNKLLDDIFPGITAPTFVKLPEVKHDGVPAQVYGEYHLRETLKQYNLPADTVWQLQAPVKFTIEARFWVAHGKITAESPYRIGNMIWGYGGFSNASQRLMDTRAYQAMRTLAEEVAPRRAAPGYTLDIGMTKDGPLVVEANAAWSSGPYDGNPEGIFKAIVASHDFEGKYPEWAWRHSPVFDKARPLKHSQQVSS